MIITYDLASMFALVIVLQQTEEHNHVHSKYGTLPETVANE